MEKPYSQQVIIPGEFGRLFGVYHPPHAEGRCPMVVAVHGFGGNKVGKHRVFVRVARALAAQGIGVLRFDLRSSGDSDGDYQDLTLRGLIDDVLTASHYIKSFEQCDPERVGILGRSLGGALAVLAAAEHQEFRSFALWASVFDAKQWKPLVMQAAEKMSHLPPETGVPFRGELATISFVKEFIGLDLHEPLQTLTDLPMLNIHGQKDAIVIPEHSERFRESREAATAPSRYIKLENSDHDFTDPHEQEKLLSETVQWFVETL